jgi:hypothetical protein
MITKTFTFLDGINVKTQDNLVLQGVTTWSEFLEVKEIKGISPKRKGYYDRKLLEARKALSNDDLVYFSRLLPLTEQWRLFNMYRDEAIYLDIETDGLGRYSDVTVIGLYDGYDTKLMIKDINLDVYALKKILSQYKILVTFNGSVFDVPFLEKRYPGVIPSIPHFDLRFCCDRVGLKGGLKEVERKLGIKRNKIVEDLYGGDALRLWKMYKNSGDEHYLNLLVEYNEEDCVNLKKIAGIVFDRLSTLG